MENNNFTKDDKAASYTIRITFSQIAEINYAIVQKALCRYNTYKFNTLKSYFSNLTSTREFVLSNKYLGEIKLDITTRYQSPPPNVLYNACSIVLGKIADTISGIEDVFEGTKEFTAVHVHDVFKDKRVNYSDPHDGGVGISQNDLSVPTENRVNLFDEDWFAFDDNDYKIWGFHFFNQENRSVEFANDICKL